MKTDVIKKFRFRKPYKKNGRTNFPDASKKSGVYIIKKNDKIIYIGYSNSDLYKTLYRHFQTWNDKQSPERISYKNQLKNNEFMVRVVYCSPKRAEALEKALILKHRPKDNKLKYNLYYEESKKSEKEYINSMEQIYEFAPILSSAPF